MQSNMSILNIRLTKLLFWSAARRFLVFKNRLSAIVSAPNIRMGSRVYIDKTTKLHGDNLINDDVRISDSVLGKYSYISPSTILMCVTTGRYCSIGPGCVIGTGIHPKDQLSTSPYIYNKQLFKSRRESDFVRVSIGNDVWIGAHTIIMGGVLIGNGAIVGANTLVNCDVPAYSIVVGSPCRVLKYRFTKSQMENIELSQWWDLEPEEARKLTNLL